MILVGGPLQVDDFSHMVESLYAPVPFEDFAQHLFQVVSRAFPGCLLTFDQEMKRTGRLRNQANFTLKDEAAWQEHVGQFNIANHPAVPYILRGELTRTFRVSDMVTMRQFRQSGLYCDFWAPNGLRFQLISILLLPDRCIGFTINRDLDFTDEELLTLQLLYPHIEQALSHSRLYSALRAPKVEGEAATAPVPEARPIPLTARELQVLSWLAQGKRDGEIAIILGISPRTVGKHVQRVYRKLGVGNRSVAAALALARRIHPDGVLPFPQVTVSSGTQANGKNTQCSPYPKTGEFD